MATYTSNYAWTKPEGSDPVDIGVLNNNLDSQDSIVHNAYMQLAPVFSTASTYAVDDVVLYANNLYKCITAVTVAGDWDATKWTQVKVSDIAGGGGGGGTSDYSQLSNKPSINSVTLSGNKTSADLGLQDAIQIDTMPTASATYVGKIVQFVGTTTASYTHGYYYECINNGGTYSWTQLDVQPSSGGGGGHTIVNGAGTSMTQRDALQFKGGLSVTDDSTNDRTVVSDEYELITWTDWQTIVANHEEDLHPNAIITDVPGADGDVSVELMTKLWENPSPTASFGAQSVPISRDGYDFTLTLFSDSEAVLLGNIVGDTGQTIINARPNNVYTSYQRRVTVGSTGLSFGDAYELTTSATTTNNAKAIPIAIYGIKTTASVKVSAIASDVSTSADHCMLSDGVTSVEDALNGIDVASVTADGVKTYSALFDELGAGVTLTLGHRLVIGDRKLAYYGNGEFGRIGHTESGGGMIEIRSVTIKATGSLYYFGFIKSDGTVAFTNNTAVVPANGTVFSIIEYH